LSCTVGGLYGAAENAVNGPDLPREAPVRVTVDPNICQGHARCWALAPEVFEIDDWGYANAQDVEVPAEHLEAAGRAVRSCPERAITATDSPVDAQGTPSS
jgi:ferredoxin